MAVNRIIIGANKACSKQFGKRQSLLWKTPDGDILCKPGEANKKELFPLDLKPREDYSYLGFMGRQYRQTKQSETPQTWRRDGLWVSTLLAYTDKE